MLIRIRRALQGGPVVQIHWGASMKVIILGEPDTLAFSSALSVVLESGHEIVNDYSWSPDLAIAPLLTQKVPDYLLHLPRLGTLIFHPSPLPYGRGASSIKWAYRRAEPITAATWFWADSGLDTGDICEQEIIKIDHSKRPRGMYEQDIIPAMTRTLKRCMENLQKGIVRRVPQIQKYATYDPII